MQSNISPVLPQSVATVRVGDDIVAYLKLQHAEIKALFDATLEAVGENREAKFLALRRLIATHEATEEELVHSEAERALGPKGRGIVVARLEEERAASTAISELERLAVDTREFEMNLRKLAADVVEHATHEETEELPALPGKTSERLARVRRVAEQLYSDQFIESLPRSQEIGPFVTMLNRARDLFAGNLTREGLLDNRMSRKVGT